MNTPCEIRLVTIPQPRASAISFGLIQTETRKWATDYRGWVAIHAAGKAVTQSQVSKFVVAAELITGSYDCLLVKGSLNWLKRSPKGCVVALARIADCQEITTTTQILDRPACDRALGDWQSGRFAWDLADVIPFEALWQCPSARMLGKIRDPYMLQEFCNLIAMQQIPSKHQLTQTAIDTIEQAIAELVQLNSQIALQSDQKTVNQLLGQKNQHFQAIYQILGLTQSNRHNDAIDWLDANYPGWRGYPNPTVRTSSRWVA